MPDSRSCKAELNLGTSGLIALRLGSITEPDREQWRLQAMTSAYRKLLQNLPRSFAKLSWRIENDVQQVEASGLSQRAMAGWQETTWPLSAWQPHLYGGFNESGP